MENKHKLKIVKKNEEIKQFFIDDKEINLNGLEKILIDVAYTRGSYPTEKITVTFIDFESLEIINEEITPSKTSELMMKVSVSVELKEISTEDLQNELLSRQREIYDIEKEILVLWANGKGLQELAKKYGEFAAVVIEDFKNKNTNKVGINQHFTGVYGEDTMYELAKKGAKEALMDIKEDERMEDKITEERVREIIKEELNSLFDLEKELVDKTKAKGYVQETVPEEAKENVVWLQPKTEEFHILKNGKWKKVGDKDVLPALKSAMISRAGLIKF